VARIRTIVVAGAIAATVLAGSSDPDGWAGAQAAAPAALPATAGPPDSASREPVGRRWASLHGDGRRWTASLEPRGRRWHSG
jgi:hypothetical protein